MQNYIYVTNEGLSKLKQELENLKKERHRVAKRIHNAKEFGDLAENSEYEDAKNEQSFVEGKIIELEDMIGRAKIVARNGNNKVEIGSTVVLDSSGGKVEYTIVGASESDPGNGKISIESPLGYSLIGKTKGEEVETITPRGKINHTIVEIK